MLKTIFKVKKIIVLTPIFNKITNQRLHINPINFIVKSATFLQFFNNFIFESHAQFFKNSKIKFVTETQIQKLLKI